MYFVILSLGGNLWSVGFWITTCVHLRRCMFVLVCVMVNWPPQQVGRSLLSVVIGRAVSLNFQSMLSYTVCQLWSLILSYTYTVCRLWLLVQLFKKKCWFFFFGFHLHRIFKNLYILIYPSPPSSLSFSGIVAHFVLCFLLPCCFWGVNYPFFELP